MFNRLKNLFRAEPTEPPRVADIDMDTTPTREDVAKLAKPAFIARQGGQKRNRVHLYIQPYGYPIRICDFFPVTTVGLEILFDEKPSASCRAPISNMLIFIKSEGGRVCSHCLAVVQKKRATKDGKGAA